MTSKFAVRMATIGRKCRDSAPIPLSKNEVQYAVGASRPTRIAKIDKRQRGVSPWRHPMINLHNAASNVAAKTAYHRHSVSERGLPNAERISGHNQPNVICPLSTILQSAPA